MKTDDLGWGVRSDPPPRMECVVFRKSAKKSVKEGSYGGSLKDKKCSKILFRNCCKISEQSIKPFLNDFSSKISWSDLTPPRMVKG